jgi:2-C-methyl-D-erythritol 4-phosphate cytidylyltransferase
VVRRVVAAVAGCRAVAAVVVTATHAAVPAVRDALSGGTAAQVDVVPVPEPGWGAAVLAVPRIEDPWLVVVDPAEAMAAAADVDAVLARLAEPGAPGPGAVGAVAVTAVTDTLKHLVADGTVAGTADREHFRAVRTPQAYAVDALLRAVRSAPGAALVRTDAAALVSVLVAAEGIVVGVPVPADGVLVVSPSDVAFAEATVVSAARVPRTPTGSGFVPPAGSR